MNVLYLSYDGMTDALGQSQVIPYLTGLSKEGHKFVLISFEKRQRFELLKNKINSHLKEAGISWQPVMYTSKPPIISTIWDIFKMKYKANSVYKEHKFEIVHSRGYISAIVGMSLKKKFNVKFVFDMRGFFADERVDGGLWNLKNPVYKMVYKYFKYKEIKFFSNADYIVSLTQNGKDEIHSWKLITNQPVPIEVIPCCADMNLFSSKYIDGNKYEAMKSELGFNDPTQPSPNTVDGKDKDLIISYLGSIGTWYMLEEMFDFFERVLLRYGSAKFFFITNDDKKYILDKATKKGIPNKSVIITNSAREDVPYYIKMSNISLFFIKPVFSKKASSPTKQGEVMSLGIPIICNANVGDTDKIINDSKTGYVINEFTVNEYDRAVNNIENLFKISEETIKSTAFKYFSLQNGIKKYNEIYNRIA